MIKTVINKICDFLKVEEGAGLAEYALLLFLIAIVCVAILGTLGGTIQGVFAQIAAAL